MELKTYINVLLRRKWVILITIVVTLAVVIIGTLLTTPVYSATTTLRIATAANGSINYSDYMYADRLINTYVQMSTTKPVLDELKRRLNLNELPQIGVDTIPNTELIRISVEHQDPTQAANIANTLGEVLMSQSLELYTGSGKSSMQILSDQVTRMEEELNQARKEYSDLLAQKPSDTEAIQAAKQAMDLKQEIYAATLDQYEQTRLREALLTNSVTVVDPAFPPLSPTKPHKTLNIALGLMVGLIGGVGLAFLLDNLDSTLYSTKQIEELTKLPNLGMVPNARIQKRFITVNGNNPYSEAFRRIRTRLFSQEFEKPLRTLLITSPEPGEGKSTIIAGLARILAQSGNKVILADADMRLPTQHKIFDLPNNQGLSNVLSQESGLKQVLQETDIPNLKVLTSGPVPENPSRLIDTIHMDNVVGELQESFDLILIDTPALLEVNDAAVLAPQMDGVILVVCRANSRKEDVLAACKQLEGLKANVLGFITNQAEQNNGYYYHSRKQPPFKKFLSTKSRLKDVTFIRGLNRK